jgi:hypothetical protein
VGDPRPRVRRRLALPALAALGLVAALCWAPIAWDVIHYREHRTEIRQARP